MWVKEVQRSISKVGVTRIIRLTYELFNPEVEQMRKFFNGPVVEYYAIQNEHLLKGPVPADMKERYRETILSELLGYEVQLIDRKEKRRKSSADFLSTQQWNDFLEKARETIFEPQGYEFPSSETFWGLAEKHGIGNAHRICREELQGRIRAKMAVPQA